MKVQMSVQNKQTASLFEELAKIRAKAEKLDSDKQRERELINELIENGLDLQVLENYVSKAKLEEQIARIEENREREKEELWNELEATADVFMPKTKLQEILNGHAAQLDELRRMMTAKPEQVSAKRVWNDNTQTFEEHSDDDSDTGPPNTTQRSLPTPSRRGDSSLQQRAPPPILSESPSQYEEPASRTRMDVELELAASRRERLALESDVAHLRELVGTLQDARFDASPMKDAKSSPSPVRHRYQHELRGQAQPSPAKGSPLGRNFTVASPRGLPTPDRNYEGVHPGEEWMLDENVQRLLAIQDDARSRVRNLRADAQGKVMQLRLSAAQSRGHQLPFQDKLALFTTGNVSIHDEIAREVLEENNKTLYFDSPGPHENLGHTDA